jgi:hypothetical protein
VSFDEDLCWLLLRDFELFNKLTKFAGFTAAAPKGIINEFPWDGALGSTSPPPTLIPEPDEVEERLLSVMRIKIVNATNYKLI